MLKHAVLLALFAVTLTPLGASAQRKSASSAPRAQTPARSARIPSRARKITTYLNPVFDEDFPDPTVMRASDNYFYAYATQTDRASGMVNIQVARSQDLVRWTHLGDALQVKPVWAKTTQKLWAPHVAEHNGKFYMYYSADPDTQTGLCLAVAIADNPAGPFTDKGSPLLCGEGFINIDPMSFDDPRTGKRLLYWGSGFAPIKVQELAPDRINFMPGSRPIDLIAPIKTEDLTIYQRLVEGAWVSYRAPYYYLYYSGDNCCGEKAHYAVMVARSRSATGPFQTFAAATKREQSVILERKDFWIAPGHNSIIRDDAGQDWIFYHAINPRRRTFGGVAGDRDVRRVMLADPIVYRDGFPRVAGDRPSTSRRRAPFVRRISGAGRVR